MNPQQDGELGVGQPVDPLTGKPPPQQPAQQPAAPRARFSWTAVIAAVLAAAALVVGVIALMRPTPAAIPASAPITTTPAPAPIPAVSITSAVATSGTGQNQVVSLPIPANTLAVGTTFAIKAFGAHNATAGTSVNFQIHLGPNNTTSDPVVSTSADQPVAANGGIATDGMLTIRTTGSGGATIAWGILNNITNGATTSTTTTTQTVDTTANNFLTLSGSTSAGVLTIEVAAISVVKA
jgi:hypothetical protein